MNVYNVYNVYKNEFCMYISHIYDHSPEGKDRIKYQQLECDKVLLGWQT